MKLKPCPFCGIKPIHAGDGEYKIEHNERCFLGDRENVDSFYNYLMFQQEIDAWNKRF